MRRYQVFILILVVILLLSGFIMPKHNRFNTLSQYLMQVNVVLTLGGTWRLMVPPFKTFC